MHEISYGIIPLHKENGAWMVLLVSPHHGYWGFPKGHPELNETPLESATRELREETGLTVKELLSETVFIEKYIFRKGKQLIHKKVEYFIAEVVGEITLQKEEMQAYTWLPLNDALKKITYDATRQVLSESLSLIPSI